MPTKALSERPKLLSLFLTSADGGGRTPLLLYTTRNIIHGINGDVLLKQPLSQQIYDVIYGEVCPTSSERYITLTQQYGALSYMPFVNVNRARGW